MPTVAEAEAEAVIKGSAACKFDIIVEPTRLVPTT
jgi:hypothetical protein